MADLTRVAEVLAAHRGLVNDGPRYWRCDDCNGDVEPSDTRDDMDAAECERDYDLSLAAHQAQMLADAGLVASETEYGRIDCVLVRREITPWRPADEGGEA